jgi:hypothetical protein
MLNFGIRPAFGVVGDGPVIDINAPTSPIPHMQLKTDEIGKITVINGVGKRLVCRQSINGLVFDPNKSENAQAGSVAVTLNPQGFHIRGRHPGQTEIVIIGTAAQPLGEVGLILSVVPNVFTEVKTFFHFLDGPKGIKTSRTTADLPAILQTMNNIYGAQASMRFVQAGVNASLKIPGLGTSVQGVRATALGGTPDTDAIKARRNAAALFNVFFFDKFNLAVDLSDGTLPDFLALTSRPPKDDPPLRCCLMRDVQPGDPAGNDTGRTLAHEAGHALGEEDDFADTDSLMFFSASGSTNSRIVPAMAQRMQASFKQFPP